MILPRPPSLSGDSSTTHRPKRASTRATARRPTSTTAFASGLACAAFAATIAACGPIREGNGAHLASTARRASGASIESGAPIESTASTESLATRNSLAKADLPEKARRLLEAVNARRSEHGLQPLRYDSRLGAAAHGFAREMAARDFFAHSNPEGVAPEERISAKGYPWVATAENIAFGESPPEAVVDGWMRSPAHRANLLDPLYTEMGAGYASNPGSRFRRFWVLDFGKPARGR